MEGFGAGAAGGRAGMSEPDGATQPDAGTLPADEPATVAEAPGALREGDRPRTSPGPAPSEGSLPTSPSRVSPTAASATTTRALHAEEAERTRGFGRVVALIAGAMLLFVPFLGGDPVLRLVAAGALIALTAIGVWIWRRGALEDRYSPRVFRLFGWACVTCALAAVFYLGVFSAAPVALTMGIAFFGLGGDRRFALAICATCAGVYVLLASLVAAGVLPDQGLLGTMASQPVGRLAAVVMVPVVLAVTLWQARVSRQATIDAMERAQAALRVAGQREAQLQEANQNLDRALRAGAGQSGRYTGTRAGRYTLDAIVGRGAMGEVYSAKHEGTGAGAGDVAAVKVLNAFAARDPDLLRRFHREGELASKLSSPHVVKVHETGELPDGCPYLAMELLRGEDLATVLRRKRQLDLEEVVELIAHVATGLDTAHRAGVVHRDVKPQNLFRAEDERGQPTWKLVDFGISKGHGTTGTLTQRAVVGTPGYMAPEQAQGKGADHRSDTFALGAVVYRALTGRPPFAGPDMPQVLFEIVYRAPLRPSELAHGIPEDVDRVLAIALAKKPDDRFQSGAELAKALADASKGALDPTLRTRADRLITAMPWGRRARVRLSPEKDRTSKPELDEHEPA